MWKWPLAVALSSSIIMISGPAAATNYCWFPGGPSLADGNTATEELHVVVSTVKRTHGGDRQDRWGPEWCGGYRTSLGGNSTSRIIEPPKLGKVMTQSYWIAYRGDRVGRDRMVIERTWLNPQGKRFRGILTYDIYVHAAPF
jgi:hypothetical protein